MLVRVPTNSTEEERIQLGVLHLMLNSSFGTKPVFKRETYDDIMKKIKEIHKTCEKRKDGDV